ncbi:MAG: hypothetical protein R2712_03225 [Vicinamibacterales bacterium]
MPGLRAIPAPSGPAPTSWPESDAGWHGLRAALDGTSSGVLIFDPLLRILHMNEGFRVRMLEEANAPEAQADVLETLARTHLTPDSLSQVRGLLANIERAIPPPLTLHLHDGSLPVRLQRPAPELVVA